MSLPEPAAALPEPAAADSSSSGGPEPELARERAHHDRCRAALAAMAAGAVEQIAVGEHAFASGADAEVLGYELRSRARELADDPGGPLFFGRLDFGDGEDAGDHRARRYYLGRRRITGPGPEAGTPLVVDWRAPLARTFYQAGPRDPRGVRIRRRHGWAPFSTGDPAELTGFEDEHLDAPGPGPADASGGALSAIVTAELERPRIGPMRDITATIRPEQDDLVRSAAAGSLCVQGAPGTGKTAVGLHRAAYLLYTHPGKLRSGGLLVIGPDRAFLSYIERVLPSLGETGVRQSTLVDEIARHAVGAEDTPRAAAVKHDARMADVLRRALYSRVPAAPAGTALTVPDGSYRWRLDAETLAGIVAGVRAEEPPYATGRERVRSRVVREVQLAAERRSGPRGAGWVRRTERSRPVGAFLDAVWPQASPEEALAAFLADPADPALGPGERDAIRRPGPPRGSSPRAYRSVRWTAADLVLLDELAGLIERPPGYGHIVVDEAQDLSPMECRAIARRAAFGSLTVLGDLAQGTTPWAARDWPRQLALLGRAGTPVTVLTTGFRMPRAVVRLANGLLPSLGVDVPPARSLRYGGELTVRRVTGLAAAAVTAVRSALTREGTVAVIAAGPDTDRLRTALGPLAAEAGERLSVLPATAVKGLEYDHVVVVEPAAIAAAEERGLHRLYVVLTRAVSRLDVLHERPLPPQLTDTGRD
ncbi:HelD family protein [Streptomyces tsukubensis]